MVRHRLSDEEWNEIWDMFPERKATGRPPKPAREIMDGICWMLRAGSPWRDLPEEFGAWETVYAHFNRWTSDGTLARIFTRLQQQFSEDERYDHSLWCIDGTVVRAHRCAGGGGKKGIPTNPRTTLLAVPAVDFPRKSTSSARVRASR